MSKNKKYMIEYLDLDDDLYIENDEVKMKVHEGAKPQDCTWEELWAEVINALDKMEKYDEAHTKYNNQE